MIGHYGDKIGRKSMLVLTLVIMGVATFLIGLLPTYEQLVHGRRSDWSCSVSPRASASAANGAVPC